MGRRSRRRRHEPRSGHGRARARVRARGHPRAGRRGDPRARPDRGLGAANRRARRGVPRAVRYSTGAVLALLGRLGSLVLGGVVAIVLARWLGPAARGEFALVTLVPGVLVAVAGLGLGTAELHLVSRDAGRFGAAVTTSLVFTRSRGPRRSTHPTSGCCAASSDTGFRAGSRASR